MSKETKIFDKIQNNLPISCTFEVLRKNYVFKGKNEKGELVYGDGYHEGIDYTSTLNKRQLIYNEVSGILHDVSESANSYGKKIIIKTNLGYLSKQFEGIILYSLYGHLSKYSNEVLKILETPNKFISYGTELGNMGNTGYCLTSIKEIDKNTGKITYGNWRTVTKEESEDPNFIGGVHLHLSFYLNTQSEAQCIAESENKKINEIGFFQWSKFWLNPFFVYKFLEKYNN